MLQYIDDKEASCVFFVKVGKFDQLQEAKQNLCFDCN